MKSVGQSSPTFSHPHPHLPEIDHAHQIPLIPLSLPPPSGEDAREPFFDMNQLMIQGLVTSNSNQYAGSKTTGQQSHHRYRS
jgi:hypothetical protein